MNTVTKTPSAIGELIRKIGISDQRQQQAERHQRQRTVIQPAPQPEAWQTKTKSGRDRSRFTMLVYFKEVDPATGRQKRFCYRGDTVQRDYANRNTRFDNQLAALRCKFFAIANNCDTVIVYDNSLPKPQDEIFKMKPGGVVEINHEFV